MNWLVFFYEENKLQKKKTSQEVDRVGLSQLLFFFLRDKLGKRRIIDGLFLQSQIILSLTWFLPGYQIRACEIIKAWFGRQKLGMLKGSGPEGGPGRKCRLIIKVSIAPTQQKTQTLQRIKMHEFIKAKSKVESGETIS